MPLSFQKVGELNVWDDGTEYHIPLTDDVKKGDYLYILGPVLTRGGLVGFTITIADQYIDIPYIHVHQNTDNCPSVYERFFKVLDNLEAGTDEVIIKLPLWPVGPVITGHPPPPVTNHSYSKTFVIIRVSRFSPVVGVGDGLYNDETDNVDSFSSILGVSGGTQWVNNGSIVNYSGGDYDWGFPHPSPSGFTNPGDHIGGGNLKKGWLFLWVVWSGPNQEHINALLPEWTAEELSTNSPDWNSGNALRMDDYEESLTGFGIAFTSVLVDTHILWAYREVELSEVDGTLKLNLPILDPWIPRISDGLGGVPPSSPDGIHWLARLAIWREATLDSLDMARLVIGKQPLVFYSDDGVIKVDRLTDGEDNSVEETVIIDDTGDCRTPAVQSHNDNIPKLIYLRDEEVIYAISRDSGKTWEKMEVGNFGTLATYAWEGQKADRAVFMFYESGEWLCAIGTLEDDGTLTLSALNNIGVNADEVLGTLSYLGSGRWEFLYKDTDLDTWKIVRCDKLNPSGSGTWS
jgi:hypothetical protein